MTSAKTAPEISGLAAPVRPALKAIVLGGGFMLRERLGGRTVLDCVTDNALAVVPAESVYVVAGDRLDEVRGAAALRGFEGNLLILYSDTPLFRAASIRGLLNRHYLKKAHLTLLTAVVDRPFPHGRIIRDSANAIVDVVEEDEASGTREVTAGAYVVEAGALERLTPCAVDGEHRLIDCLRQLIRSGLTVESYQINDPDEVQGINAPEDLERAAFIVEKRRRQEEENLIRFGTGGWRAIIGEGFTMHNVRRLSQALANEITRRNWEERGAMIGFEHRFLSRQAAEAAAEVFAGNNIPVVLLAKDAPAPLATYATAVQNSAFGLCFTAGHNPPEWNGLKVFHGDGSLLLDHETQQIEAEAKALTPRDVIKLEFDLALEAGIVQRRDFTNEYVDAVERLIDLEAIRNAGLKVIVDRMYGVGQLPLGTVLTEARCHVAFIHERHTPLLNPEALRLLASTVRDDGYDLGLAMDGDADRIAIVDERGETISINDILLLVYWYIHDVRGERGGVVRNLGTSHMLDRLAHRFGEECYEVPVGFNHIVAAMQEHNALLGGESSGGLTIRGHILGKDGILASALTVEMLANTGRKISELLEEIHALAGRLYYVEESVAATPEMRIEVPRRVEEAPASIGPYAVTRVSHIDGTKFYLENDDWALLRFSGTEPVLRLAAEADSPEKARELIGWLRQFVAVS